MKRAFAAAGAVALLATAAVSSSASAQERFYYGGPYGSPYESYAAQVDEYDLTPYEPVQRVYRPRARYNSDGSDRSWQWNPYDSKVGGNTN